jgi:hypothetical protein
MTPSFLRSWKDPVSVGLALLLLVLVAIEALWVPHSSPKFPWHHVPGYAAVIGLGACLIVVQLSKALGKWFLQRPEAGDE